MVVGPTGVGKTALAIKLAQHYKTEIVSADSRQIFREMTIGTAKPSESELQAVPHHFINSHSIHQHYDAAQFGHDALACIQTLFLKHEYVIFCGGSGLYVKAVCEGFDEIPEVPESIREDLIHEFEKNGLAWLQQKMEELDAAHFASIDKHNPHRLIRALEVKLGTGKSISEFQQKSKLNHSFDIVKIGLTLERDELFLRINNRMDAMIEAGLFDEARSLYTYKDHQALQTVGYQEIFDYFDGQYDHTEAVRLLKRNSRRYAKRQMTWFRRDENIRWFSPNEINDVLQWIGTRSKV